LLCKLRKQAKVHNEGQGGRSYLEWMLHVSYAVVCLIPIDMRVAKHVNITAKAAQLAL
jgi:hypothetical protein